MKTNIFKENLYKLPSFKKVAENTTFFKFSQFVQNVWLFITEICEKIIIVI